MATQQLRKVLVVGAGGTNIGHHVAKALANDSSFELSILSRAGSKSIYPSNARVVTIPGNATHEDYVQALQGQDAVVSGLGFEGKPTEKAIIDAAVEAGVKRFLPSEYGVDNTNPAASAEPRLQAQGRYYRVSEEQGGDWADLDRGPDWNVAGMVCSFDPSLFGLISLTSLD